MSAVVIVLLGLLSCRPTNDGSAVDPELGYPRLPDAMGDYDATRPDVDSNEGPVLELPTPSTRQMASLLKTLAAQADPERNPSLPRTKRLEQLQAMRLRYANNPSQRVAVESHIAWYLMLDGKNEESVDRFDKVLANRKQVTSSVASFNRNLFELAGLANFRLAEQQNCIMHHGHESCIIPIQGSGIHEYPEPARKARVLFQTLARQFPEDPRYRWLINLAYMALGEYPDKVPEELLIPPSAFDSDYDIGRFHDIAMKASVDYVGLSGGAIMDDFNNDGHLDLVASDWALDGQLRIYRNVGDGTFLDDTDDAGLQGEVGGLNLVSTDFDNDGRIDILVLRGAWLSKHGEYPNSLLRNLGNGRFEDVTERAGLMSRRPTQTATWADFDRDGFLDLFIGNESSQGEVYPCELYRNNGDGTFTDIADQAGVAHVGFVKGVASADFDNDGKVDLFLSCFGQPNVLYRNTSTADGTIQFNDVTAAAGVEQPEGSFPTWFWDYNNDGWEDLLVAPFSGFKFDGTSLATVVNEYLGKKEPNADRVHLYRNNQDGTFTNVAPDLQLDAALLVMGANFGDLDNDGFLDCYFGTGDPHFSTLVPNRMFRNDAGSRFQDVTTSGGFGHIQKGHGIAFGDVDGDGDEDIFAVMGGAISGDVYQNVLFQNPGHGNHWITLQLRGVSANRAGIGARIQVTVVDDKGKSQTIHRTVNSGGSFGAASLQQEIGIGKATTIARLEVKWPSTAEPQVFTDVEVDRVYEVREGDAELR